jgi:FkbM family methyltransferase
MQTGGALTKLMSLVGRRPVTLRDFEELQDSRALLAKYAKIQEIAAEGAPYPLIQFLLEKVANSNAQQLQDLIALYLSDFHSGYFVEFGATDGIDLSNTYLLERNYFWNGILAEPARVWSRSLKANRTANISTDCVYSASGLSLEFLETKSSTLSSLTQFAHDDLHSESRQKAVGYLVKTISLMDLLKEFNAPHYIDFMSVDTEGSEFKILNSFDFKMYRFGFISVEHNHTENDVRLDDLMYRNGYSRILRSSSDFDAWYVDRDKHIEFLRANSN